MFSLRKREGFVNIVRCYRGTENRTTEKSLPDFFFFFYKILLPRLLVIEAELKLILAGAEGLTKSKDELKRIDFGRIVLTGIIHSKVFKVSLCFMYLPLRLAFSMWSWPWVPDMR